MTTTAQRRAAYNLAPPSAPLVMRTWHGVQFTDGGTRGFLIGMCPHAAGLLALKQCGADVIHCCVPLSRLAGFPTLHGGVRCPGESCAEGDALPEAGS